MSVWDFVEALTGKGEAEIKAGMRVVATRLIGVVICECGHMKGLHREGQGCSGVTAGKGCSCKAFEPRTKLE